LTFECGDDHDTLNSILSMIEEQSLVFSHQMQR